MDSDASRCIASLDDLCSVPVEVDIHDGVNQQAEECNA